MIDIENLQTYDDIVLDTGIYIEYFMLKENKIKKMLREQLFSEDSEIIIRGHYLIKAEIYYIMCRKIGRDKAEEYVKDIEDFITFTSGEFLVQIAGRIKCKYPIALSDCFSISLGYFQNCPIFFLEEKELSKDLIEKINKDFDTKAYVISEF